MSNKPEDEEIYHFDAPEDVLIIIIEDDVPTHGWRKYSIEECVVIPRDDGKMGAATYEQIYGFIDYTITGMCYEPSKAGAYVIESVTAETYKDDHYGDVDIMYYCKGIREATEEETFLLR